MFELVVFILVIAIIYSVAANRFSQFPGAAERANFLAVITQVQTGINLEAMSSIAKGNPQIIAEYQDANPMDLLLEAPSNYIGAFDVVVESSLPRRSWYFDRSRGELVYLVNDTDNVFLLINEVQVPTAEIRFKMAVKYSYENRDTGRAVPLSEIGDIDQFPNAKYRRRINGVLMGPLNPYFWSQPAVSLPDTAIADFTGSR